MIETQQTATVIMRIGDQIPDFEARTTQGTIKLSDYRGRWLIFFSHPADFTPVCTTEFIALADKADQFAAMRCALVGLSVDSLYSHLAWIRVIKEQYGADITFPIVEDPSMAVGKAFGMIGENAVDSTAMRTSYFIDPEGIIRATTCYPHNVGRSVDEMIRILAALQTVADGTVLTPEGWQPGDDVLDTPPASASDIGTDEDWFCKRVKPA
ncbi:peroxiredoxin [Parasphingorhabdus halotolerans]|uniref:Alkyl hydroperoxide reductase C n=1 Tax=Parasphingorhabdus halotolerans TaxID=2725558 RepID=A0A6H2DRT7_9SPHN|nr:peroxiredoxin [Parasphingorhabdus halotolerans]QJB70471.1 peroxiredoxin [Parasphingorhabdus halotolerans]